MNETVMREMVHQAVDSHCAHLKEDYWLANRVIAMAQEPETQPIVRRRKLPVALIVVLVLMLLSVTAVATVVLSGKDFVRLFAGPMLQENESILWTDEELEKLLMLAEENGVAISEDMQKQTYKEELLRLFMKEDLGFYPATWPIAEQAWYDEMLVHYGLKSEQTRFMPEEGEISENEALSIAKTYILTRYDVDIADSVQFTRYMQYMLTEDENGQPCKRWDIEFEAADGTVYIVSITPGGDVIENESRKREPEPTREPDTRDHQAYVQFSQLIAEDAFYTVENLASYKDTYGALVEEFATNNVFSRMEKELLDIPYALPKDADITPDQALDAARSEALTQGWSDEWLSWCRYSVSYRAYPDQSPVYRVCYKLLQDQRHLFYEGAMPFGIVIYVRPDNGTIIEVVQLVELDEYENCCEFPDVHDTTISHGNG